MKKQTIEGEGNKGRSNEGSKSINMKNRNWKPKEKKKMRGLSLEAFANAKSGCYNPSTIKKQREFYKNAKYVKKYKKSIKQQSQQNEVSTAIRPYEDDKKTEDGREMDMEKKKKRKKNSLTLRQLYEKKHEEEVKKRREREAIIQAKKEEREKAQARRKATRENMLKKTRSGQPVMKYRIEHILDSLQDATRNGDGKTH
ncbi:hypothetical protein FEM48_Zijuj09G0029200 [Ziziphus jujuba var. spinosa]|uniref:rRNA-processing protein FYV7 n=1 Tax=Ziziphus jujuba var. spinosa TaxID=714518 RepID=A0A978UQH6_ZIZJJ|nr:hypothetical protein FEM48_Zijuj09G0029200 [Ziziphus jujuba var. spinosa]